MLQSLDAYDWAKAFAARYPIVNGGDGRCEDVEELMIGWFANAIMRGWDGHAQRYPDLTPQLAAGEARAAALQQQLDEAKALNHEYNRAMCATNDAIHRVERAAGMVGAGSFAIRLDGIATVFLQREALREDIKTQRDEFFARLERVEREAEAAIVSLQAERDRESAGWEHAEGELAMLQAQLQAITQEMREKAQAIGNQPGYTSNSLAADVRSELRHFADRISALTERPTAASPRCLAVDPDGGKGNT